MVIKFQFADNLLFRVQILLVEKHKPKTRETNEVFFWQHSSKNMLDPGPRLGVCGQGFHQRKTLPNELSCA